ncbi:MAG: HupE/UreJ family protein, partial [Vicinamibacteria bacterium]
MRSRWLPFLLFLPLPASAHDAGITSVTRVFLSELGHHRYALSVIDAGVPPLGDVESVLPSGCRVLPGEPAPRVGFRVAFECERPLAFDDAVTLPWSLGVAVVARWGDGSGGSAYFAPEGGTVTIELGELGASADSGFRLGRRYFVLGAEHILLGIDHLLFVLGLMALVRGVGSLVKTITAFTIAHSITLGAAVLGVVSIENGPVEAAIALSIVLLGREIVVGHRGANHLVHRWPWLVAFVFGLLHGFGFAGALGRIGLRSDDIPAALLSFNLGVEAGQLAFVALVLAAVRILRFRFGELPGWLSPALGYSLGTLAVLWFGDRLSAVWGA